MGEKGSRSSCTGGSTEGRHRPRSSALSSFSSSAAAVSLSPPNPAQKPSRSSPPPAGPRFHAGAKDFAGGASPKLNPSSMPPTGSDQKKYAPQEKRRR